MFSGLYRGKRVFVTGHTGFKGSWLTAWLLNLGADVGGFSIGVPTEPSNFKVLDLEKRITHFAGDIRDRKLLGDAIDSFKPEAIFHLAAQPIVRESFADPVTTFETNVMGTMNVLELLRTRPSIKAGIIITSDKCYKNLGWTWGYRENDTLGGGDPYSASKACAELIFHSYCESFLKMGSTRVATTRAGNVIGGGDWAADRIVPDTVRAWSKKKSVTVRYPKATRPWQHVLEPLGGYLWLGVKLLEGQENVNCESFNFGPMASVNQPVAALLEEMKKYWSVAEWEIEKVDEYQEASLLKLSCDKALNALGWEASLSFAETVRMTCEWYQAYYEKGGKGIYDLTMEQINNYVSIASDKGLEWTK
ncbi:MAG: CDP-glucose 4,6-dehydratase [Nitrospinota bacterium]|nr:CDP-glucose 4,6-dehydratase [Nitrospinota bacterium]